MLAAKWLLPVPAAPRTAITRRCCRGRRERGLIRTPLALLISAALLSFAPSRHRCTYAHYSTIRTYFLPHEGGPPIPQYWGTLAPKVLPRLTTSSYVRRWEGGAYLREGHFGGRAGICRLQPAGIPGEEA